MEQGFLYILTNTNFPHLIKIGHTTRSIEERIAELNTTGLPSPFVPILKWKIHNCKKAELFIHDKFSIYRYNSNREFFKIECLGEVVKSVENWISDNNEQNNNVSAVPQATGIKASIFGDLSTNQYGFIDEYELRLDRYRDKLVRRVFKKLNNNNYYRNIENLSNSLALSCDSHSTKRKSKLYIEYLQDEYRRRAKKYLPPFPYRESRATFCIEVSTLYSLFHIGEKNSNIVDFSSIESNFIKVFYKKNNISINSDPEQWELGKTHIKVCDLPTKALKNHPEQLNLDILNVYACLASSSYYNYIPEDIDCGLCRAITKGDILQIGETYLMTDYLSPDDARLVAVLLTSYPDTDYLYDDENPKPVLIKKQKTAQEQLDEFKKTTWIKSQKNNLNIDFSALGHLVKYKNVDEKIEKYFSNIYDGIHEEWMKELQNEHSLPYPSTPTVYYWEDLKHEQKLLEEKWRSSSNPSIQSHKKNNE